MDSKLCETLMQKGFVVVPKAVDPKRIGALSSDLDQRFQDTPYCEGDFYGRQTKRFGSLLLRSPHAEMLVRHPMALGLAAHALGPNCDRIMLNLTQAIEIHAGAPAQYPHRDEDMWGGPKGAIEYLVNIIWPLTPFSEENGATRLWPKGAASDGGARTAEEDAIFAEMQPGDMLAFLGSTLHGGGQNHTALPRRAVIISYCLGWLRPFENQWLIYPPAVAKQFDPELAALVGYAQHRPNLGNVEGQCPSRLLGKEAIADTPVAAIDALRDDQAEALRAWVNARSNAQDG